GKKSFDSILHRKTHCPNRSGDDGTCHRECLEQLHPLACSGKQRSYDDRVRPPVEGAGVRNVTRKTYVCRSTAQQLIWYVRTRNIEFDLWKDRSNLLNQKRRCFDVWCMAEVTDEENFDRALEIFRKRKEFARIDADRDCTKVAIRNIRSKVTGILLCHSDHSIKFARHQCLVTQ